MMAINCSAQVFATLIYNIAHGQNEVDNVRDRKLCPSSQNVFGRWKCTQQKI